MHKEAVLSTLAPWASESLSMVNQKFGRLIVHGISRSNPHKWSCSCSCGNPRRVDVKAAELITGRVVSCGCLKSKVQQEARNAPKQTATYRSWEKMMRWCRKRRLTTDIRWKRYNNFLKDMGPQPAGTLLRLIEDGRGFEKSNCAWQPMDRAALPAAT